MAVPAPSLNYIAEWMASVGLIQADLVNKLGWSKAKANAVWNREQRVNEDILREVAPLVSAEPHELLMPPGRAHQLRRIVAILDEAVHKEQASAAEEKPSAESPKVAKLRPRKAG